MLSSRKISKKAIVFFSILSFLIFSFSAVGISIANSNAETTSSNTETADSGSTVKNLRVIFTSDLHSHILPYKTSDQTSSYTSTEDNNIESVGGYATLGSRIIDARNSAEGETVTLDSGDFSQGSIFNWGFKYYAPNLRFLSQMHYDATTLGNHEFDYDSDGLAQSLNSANKLSTGYKTPIVTSNMTLDESNSEGKELSEALKNYGNSQTLLIQKGDVKIGVFGLIGEGAVEDTVAHTGVTFDDAVECAQRSVDKLKSEGANMIIALSHTGITDMSNPTADENSDGQIAQKVSGIDLILSGHAHTSCEQPLKVNNTYIACCGCYAQYLDVIDFNINLSNNEISLGNANLEKNTSDYTVNKDVQKFVDGLENEINTSYSNDINLKTKDGKITDISQTIIKSDINMYRANDNYSTTKDGRLNAYLGGLITQSLADMVKNDNLYYLRDETQLTDSMRTDAKNGSIKDIKNSSAYASYDESAESTGNSSQIADTLIGVTANGVVRDTLYKGDLTFSDIYSVLSFGSGVDNKDGCSLALVYLKGSELRNVTELDSSIYGMMSTVSLGLYNMKYTYSDYRIPLNRTISVQVKNNSEQWENVDDNKLYPVVCDHYMLKRMSLLSKATYNMLSLSPRDEKGNVITNPDDAVVRYSNGEEVKTWEALEQYLIKMNDEGKTLNMNTVTPTEREEVGINPITFFENPNAITWIVLGLFAVLIILIILLVLLIKKICKKIKARKNGKNNGKAGDRSGKKSDKKSDDGSDIFKDYDTGDGDYYSAWMREKNNSEKNVSAANSEKNVSAADKSDGVADINHSAAGMRENDNRGSDADGNTES